MTFRFPLLAAAASLALVPAIAVAQSGALTNLIADIDVPYQAFTLPNGLRVIVHTDRRAPLVAVNVWYNVGSKNEPAGKTGFAHLFEHLMFNGSENVPGDFFEPLKQIGATEYNGTTYFDRTNYFETVPSGALERALFLESDRMGWLTGAITQDVLDVQRGVVQNEKRQGDNQPYGLVQYHQVSNLLPADHPYGHTPIGSMKDLDTASLADVKGWFHDHYGPNNAVLVLAGDVDVATARPLVEKYFGAIARGPETTAPKASVVALPHPIVETMKDRVAMVMIDRSWTVPGVNDPDATGLEVAAGVLGGLASSRLDNIMVRQEKLAVSVSASHEALAQIGTFNVHVMVRPGVDPVLATRRLDEIMRDFLAKGPTAAEVERVKTRQTVDMVEGFESLNQKAQTLAEGQLYAGDPDHYRKQLTQLAAQTPESVRRIARHWLSRPAYTLTVVPGPRETYAEAAISPRPPVADAAPPAPGTRGAWPAIGEAAPVQVPTVSRAKLSNGIELIYARQNTIPFTRVVLSFDAGTSADPADGIGTQDLMLAMLKQGTQHLGANLTATGIAEEEERLGARIAVGATPDRSTVAVSTPSATAREALTLLADVTLHPIFAESELTRQRDAQRARIAQEMASPADVASRTLAPLLYGADHPYARALGSGDPAVVARLSAADLRAFHQAWLRPDKAKIFITSDRSLAEVSALLEGTFGPWRGTGQAGTKPFPQDGDHPAPSQIVLVDRPDSPQSYVLGAYPTRLDPREDMIPVQAANQALGGDFLSRLNMDLREDKHWTYGVRGRFRVAQFEMPYLIAAPVQADRTADSIKAMRDDLQAFLTTAPMTKPELERTVAGEIRSLPGTFANSDTVLETMQSNDLLGRPDDYYAHVGQRYTALSLDQANGAIRKAIDPSQAIWVVVGDARIVAPQLKTLGLSYRTMPGPVAPAK